MDCNCGGKSGSSVDYEARSNTGGTRTFTTNTEARLFLATNGGGLVKAVPRKKAA